MMTRIETNTKDNFATFKSVADLNTNRTPLQTASRYINNEHIELPQLTI